MIKKKFSWSVYFIVIFFSLVVILGIHALFLLLTNQVTDENGYPLYTPLVYFLTIACSLVLFTYLSSVLSLLIQIIIHKNQALYIDENGIHNTVVFVNVLAFLFVGKITFIPWKAVKHFDNSNGKLYIRVKANQVTAPKWVKIIISVLGYSFCQGLISPKYNDAEIHIIEQYINSYSSINVTTEQGNSRNK